MAAGINDGNVNPGRLKAPTVMLAGVVAAGMFNDSNVSGQAEGADGDVGWCGGGRDVPATAASTRAG
ncbi:hypothetical protein ABLN89_15760 [Mycobacterium tuberculosis]